MTWGMGSNICNWDKEKKHFFLFKNKNLVKIIF